MTETSPNQDIPLILNLETKDSDEMSEFMRGRVLKSTDPKLATISQIAIEWGFWHMGQFSADYKKMFGETPSTTLRFSFSSR